MLAFFSSIRAQSELGGEYNYYTANDEKLPFNYKLILNCDKTFYMEDTIFLKKDSSMIGILKGSWIIKKDTILELSVDSIISHSKFTGNLQKMRYFIRNDQLHDEIITEKQYKRRNRKLDKKFQNCLGWEPYEKFRKTQDNRYFVKINAYGCK